jgi:hypothetical protein
MATKSRKLAQENPGDVQSMTMVYMSEYQMSWGIRGDNAPEKAQYLGYLLAKDLYPDLEFTRFETFIAGVLEGKGKAPYS